MSPARYGKMNDKNIFLWGKCICKNVIRITESTIEAKLDGGHPNVVTRKECDILLYCILEMQTEFNCYFIVNTIFHMVTRNSYRYFDTNPIFRTKVFLPQTKGMTLYLKRKHSVTFVVSCFALNLVDKDRAPGRVQLQINNTIIQRFMET